MYNKDQIKNIKNFIKNLEERNKTKIFSVHFGRVTDRELNQLKEVFSDYKIEKEILGYIKFTKI